MRGITKFSMAAAIIGIGSLLISYIGGPSRAAVDNTPDCDTVAIMYCGSFSESQFHSKWNNDKKYKDHQAVYGAFGIKKSDVSGMVDGIVWKDGRVTLGNSSSGKVVATNATTAGRWNSPKSGMTKIAGTSRAYKMSTSHFVTTGQTAMLKLDSNGKFLFAVIKSCGNPVSATPVTPPTPKPAPTASCSVLNQPVITNRTNVALSSVATATGGATIQAHVFTILDASGKQVDQRVVTTSATTASTNFTISTPGNYTAKVVIRTSIGNKEAAACQKNFTIAAEPKPGISIDKKVDGVEHKQVGVDVEFTYQIQVKNTGNTSLKDVVVTDDAPKGVTFLKASQGTLTASKWTHTIPELKVGASASFTITAKVPEYLAGTIKNTVCVDTPTVPGNPDDCDDATIEVKKPGVNVNKKVDGVEHKAVGVNTEFKYQIRVSNTGETDLKDVVVTDNAPNGVTFLSVSDGSIVDNKWTFTIPELKVGAARDFTITAKVPTYLAGTIKNTVCVDTPTVPGSPDDCDDATIEVPEPGKIKVCELDSKTIVELPDNQQIDESKYSTDLSKCAKEPVTPTKLPETGATDGILNALGLGSLVTASLAYIASRRNSLVG